MADLPPIMANIKAGIDQKAEEEAAAKEEVFGIGTPDDVFSIHSIKDALGIIKSQFEQEQIPYKTIELGLKEVMKLLKAYEDVVLEMEPEDINAIVTSYMALADEETKTIFDKAAKKKKPAAKKSTSVKRVLAAAKEDTGEIDLSNLDF